VTGERIADDILLDAVARLPRGAGIVFRHYGLTPGQRRDLFARVRRVARRRRLMLFLAGSERTAIRWGCDGFHGRTGRKATHLLRSAPAHNLPEIRAAERAGAHILFLSPLFPTRSHPGSPTLGRARFARLARQTHLPVIALGGMTEAKARHLGALGACGWAAIDGLSVKSPPR
jgi:thiamine-phosphate pyrophosphorylase